MTQGGNSSSSSNREGGVCDAVLFRDEQPVGPMRLPLSRAEDFIDHFNRLYSGLGIKLSALAAPKDESKGQKGNGEGPNQNEKIPDSTNAAGDDVFD